jgi:hypothetical protein
LACELISFNLLLSERSSFYELVHTVYHMAEPFHGRPAWGRPVFRSAAYTLLHASHTFQHFQKRAAHAFGYGRAYMVYLAYVFTEQRAPLERKRLVPELVDTILALAAQLFFAVPLSAGLRGNKGA